MRISQSRGRTYQLLLFTLIFGPASSALFLVATDSRWMLVVPLGLTTLLLVGVIGRIRSALVLDFSQGQISISRGSTHFTIPHSVISAIGVAGHDRRYHVVAWIPTQQMSELQFAVKMLKSRPPSDFGEVTAVPLIESSEIGRKRTLRLRSYLETHTDIRWRSVGEENFRGGNERGIW